MRTRTFAPVPALAVVVLQAGAGPSPLADQGTTRGHADQMGTRGLTDHAHARAPAHHPHPGAPADYHIVEGETLFAVVTQRAGVAARFAHDHLVYPERYDTAVDFDPDAPEEARLSLEFEVRELKVDDAEWKARTGDRLQELGLLPEPFRLLSADEAADVREAMLGEDQLAAERHPRIRLETTAVERVADDAFPFRVRYEITITDATREREVRARVAEEGDGRVVVEAFGSLRFTDFGISPYRAFLGAVGTEDEFFLYAWIVLEEA